MKEKTVAKIIGTLFLIAMFTSLAGGSIIESVLNELDYSKNISSYSNQMNIGVLLEIINAVSVIGIAVFLFPVIKRYSEKIAAGYLSFRIIESIFCTIAAFIPLLIINLSSNNSEYKSTINLLITTRSEIAALLIPVFFCLGAFLLYYFLFRTQIVPRFISLWGLLATIMVLTLSLINTENVVQIILVLPIILNEIFLGFWLLFKGFKSNTNFEN